jgi:hypothetical protein
MKPVYLIILSIAIFSCTKVQHKNALTIQNLKGNVKTIIDSEFEVNAHELPHGKNLFIAKMINEYDTKGNQIEILQYWYNGERSFKELIKNDDNGNFIETDDYNKGDTIYRKDSYKYNNKGYIIESYTDDTKDKISGKSLYIYNKSDKLVEVDDYTLDGKENFKTMYKFDDMDRPIEECHYNLKDGSVDKTVNVYDSIGNKAQWNMYFNNKDSSKIMYHYTNFDGEGNWRRRLEFRKELNYITERTIEYYK